jgi:hypothetical protein
VLNAGEIEPLGAGVKVGAAFAAPAVLRHFLDLVLPR